MWDPYSLWQADLEYALENFKPTLPRSYAGPGLENWEYGRGDPSRWPCGTIHLQN
jgi:hypothetical protein